MKTKSSFLMTVLLAVNVLNICAFEDLRNDICTTFSNRNCNCFKVKEFEMQCPAAIQSVVMHYLPREYMFIDCYDKNEYPLDILPNVNIDTQAFRIRFCNLEVLQFKNILQKFNITNLKYLNIEECNLGNKSFSQISTTFFENMEHLESLSIQSVSKTFAENLFENFPNLNRLYLEVNNLKEIGYYFQNNTKLKVLHLSRNSLEKLPEGVFENLSNLQELHLWKNNLKVVEKNYFRGLRSLKSLELSINLITHIEENAFSDLNDLVNISLRSNKLGNITSEIFKHNINLENIKLGGNPQLEISDYVFSNLVNLKSISMENSHIQNIFEHTFENCTNLITLELQKNELESLPQNLFKNLKKLNTLNLSNNLLKFIPNELLLPLKNLAELQLEGNQLSNINSSTFQGLNKLKVLNLKNNQISYINSIAFSFLSNLIILDLSYNHWDEEGFNVFSYLEKIEEVNVSHNNVTVFLEHILESAVNLKKLDLSHNFLTDISVAKCSKVSHHNVNINVSHNNISFIDFFQADIVAKQNINSSDSTYIRINVTNNPLICDCRNYELIRYLNYKVEPEIRALFDIRIGGLKCSEPKEFKHILIKDLQPHQMTCKYDTDCPSECTCFWRTYDRTVVIDCSYKNLQYLPVLSTKHERLEINMVGNSIESGPKENQGYENVRIFDLSNNTLTSFDWCPVHIEKLNLSHNKLKSLNADVLKTFTSGKLSQLILKQNPWTCGCSAFNLQNFLKVHYQKIVDINNILCGDDNTPLIEKKELCKSKFTIAIQIIIPILSFFLLAAIAIAFYFRYKKEIKIWLFSKNWCLWFVTEEELDKDKKYDIFLSFSHKDEDFVIQNLVPSLEKSFKLCIHSRDWIPGELINDQIVDSVYNSCRTLVVLSNNFLESAWGKLEFLMAHKQSLEEGRPRVIVIKLGNLDMNKMNDDFKAYIKTNTYVEWDDPGFWKKLMYALPHSSKNVAKINQKHANMMLKIDDKFELAAHPISQPDSTPPVIAVDTTLLKKHPLNFSVSTSINNFQSEMPLIKQNSTK